MNQGLVRIVGFIFDQIVAQKFLAGHRSQVAGFGSILGALVVVSNMVASGHFDETQAGIAWAGFVLGYKILGDAGKRQTLIDATKPVVKETP